MEGEEGALVTVATHVLSTSDNGVAAVIAVMAAVIAFEMRVRRPVAVVVGAGVRRQGSGGQFRVTSALGRSPGNPHFRSLCETGGLPP